MVLDVGLISEILIVAGGMSDVEAHIDWNLDAAESMQRDASVFK